MYCLLFCSPCQLSFGLYPWPRGGGGGGGPDITLFSQRLIVAVDALFVGLFCPPCFRFRRMMSGPNRTLKVALIFRAKDRPYLLAGTVSRRILRGTSFFSKITMADHRLLLISSLVLVTGLILPFGHGWNVNSSKLVETHSDTRLFATHEAINRRAILTSAAAVGTAGLLSFSRYRQPQRTRFLCWVGLDL